MRSPAVTDGDGGRAGHFVFRGDPANGVLYRNPFRTGRTPLFGFQRALLGCESAVGVRDGRQRWEGSEGGNDTAEIGFLLKRRRHQHNFPATHVFVQCGLAQPGGNRNIFITESLGNGDFRHIGPSL